MKAMNLISLAESLDSKVSEEVLNYLGVQPKDTEKEIIQILAKKVMETGLSVGLFNGFYFGYSIPQIGKEFDFLRIGSNYILNLEIKSESTEDKVKKQLIQNKFYLSSLRKPLKLYAYILDIDKFYCLNEDDSLSEIDFGEVVTSIFGQTDLYTDNLDTLFNALNYLVSPFNATDEFINGYYFLTPQQDNIIRDLDNILGCSTGNIMAIEGAAGTGKSLLLYDYAKRIMKINNRALIVHVAQLNSGHDKLMRTYGFSISNIKTFMENINNSVLNNFDVILIDEAQRLSTGQLELIIGYVTTNKINCILCYDEKQKMSDWEFRSESVNLIRQNSCKHYTLGKKIRTNHKLASFINKMFDLTREFDGDCTEVSLIYFKNFKSAYQYLETNIEYSFVRYTPSRYYPNPQINPLSGLKSCVGAAHEVIGQEFDNVSVMIGETFYYSDNGILCSNVVEGNPYNFLGMLYQAVTRARKKLKIVVINNPRMFKELASIVRR